MTRLRAVKRELLWSWTGRDKPHFGDKISWHTQIGGELLSLFLGVECATCAILHIATTVWWASTLAVTRDLTPTLSRCWWKETKGRTPAAHRNAPAIFRRMFGGPQGAWCSNYHTNGAPLLSRCANSFGTDGGRKR